MVSLKQTDEVESSSTMQPPLSKTEGSLPRVRTVGFSGHRHLQNPEAVAAVLRSELAALRKEEGELIALSSIAIGADTLFAQEVLRAGIKWIVVLPMPKELFREDFTPEEWAVAEDLISKAVEVRTLLGTERPGVYVDGGKAVVDESDCLFAVWNGKPAAGPGGTAEVVLHAQRLGCRVVVFREEGTGVTKIDPSKVPSLEFKPEDLLETMGPAPKLPPPPQSLLLRFKEADEEAERVAPRFRRGTLDMAGCNLAATLFAGLGLAIHANHNVAQWTVFALTLLEFAFLLLATMILFTLRRQHKPETWLQKRRMAEYCRSLLATWHCRDFIEPDSFHEVSELKELSQSVQFLHLQKAPVEIKDFRTAYTHERVMDQWKYFRREANMAEAKVRPLRSVYLVITIILLVCTLFRFLLFSKIPLFREDSFIVVLLDLSPVALPALASFALAWMAIEDLDRRAGRFRALQEKMRLTLVDLSLCGTWEGLRHSVERTERILFHEVQEWYNVSRYSAAD
jgi:hypothetical protein